MHRDRERTIVGREEVKLKNGETSAGRAARSDLPSGPSEIEPAVQDITYQLTHDISDTGENLRDAAAFAPVAVAKGLNDLVTRASAHPRKLGLALAAVAAVGLFLRRRKRFPREKARSSDGQSRLPTTDGSALGQRQYPAGDSPAVDHELTPRH